MIKLESDLSLFYQDERGEFMVSKVSDGNLPGINIVANTIPAAWELAVLSVWDNGIEVATHYDKPGDPKSKEATVTIEVANPFAEPIIHKNFPGGPEELEVYRQEVVDGIHDHWINPQGGGWTYTYHERLLNYNPSTDLYAEGRGFLLPKGIDQIEKVIDDLERDITSKGSQATTWMPSADPGLEGNRPCLQRLWFRALESGEDKYKLNMNVDFRSRDLYKAWFMNAHALRDLQSKVANDLSDRIGKEVSVGTYRDKSDSLHIYGSYFKDAKIETEKMRSPNVEDRAWTLDNSMITMMTDEAKEHLANDVDYYKKGRK